MSKTDQRPTVQSDRAPQVKRTLGWRLLFGVGTGILVVGGVWLSFLGRGERSGRAGHAYPVNHSQAGVFSSGHQIESTRTPATSTASSAESASAENSSPRSANRSSERLAQQAAAEEQIQEASRQRAEQLAAKQQELEQVAAEQEAKAKRIAEDAARVQEEKNRLTVAKLEADKSAERAAAAEKARPVYSGPSSGTLVWQGEVRGTTLVTINGSQPDQGQIVSGALPGVLVFLQPADSKHVVIAASPSPSNGFQRLTLRVQGNGVVQQTIHWSIP
jgi:hypothetical protein